VLAASVSVPPLRSVPTVPYFDPYFSQASPGAEYQDFALSIEHGNFEPSGWTEFTPGQTWDTGDESARFVVKSPVHNGDELAEPDLIGPTAVDSEDYILSQDFNSLLQDSSTATLEIASSTSNRSPAQSTSPNTNTLDHLPGKEAQPENSHVPSQLSGYLLPEPKIYTCSHCEKTFKSKPQFK